MEFKKTPKKNSTVQYSEKLKEWPDCFYLERDPKIRLALLDAADEAGLTPEENRIRRELILRRYPKITSGRESASRDEFLSVWLDFKFMAANGNGFFAKSANKRKLKNALSLLGITEAGSGQKVVREAVEREIYHLAMLYMSLCMEDKSYGAMLLGLGKLTDRKLMQKIRADIKAAAIDVPVSLQAEEECKIWTESILSAYADMFPDEAPIR